MASLNRLTTLPSQLQRHTYRYLSFEVKIAMLSVDKASRKIIQEMFDIAWTTLENELLGDHERATHCLSSSYQAHRTFHLFLRGNGGEAVTELYMSSIYTVNWHERGFSEQYDQLACKTLKEAVRPENTPSTSESSSSSSSSSRPKKRQKTDNSSSSSSLPQNSLLNIHCHVAKSIFIHGIKTRNSEALYLASLRLATYNVECIEFDEFQYSLLQLVIKKIPGTFIASLLVNRLKFSPNSAHLGTDNPLIQAAHAKNLAVAVKLIQWGADVTVKDRNNRNVLALFARHSSADVVESVRNAIAAKLYGTNVPSSLNSNSSSNHSSGGLTQSLPNSAYAVFPTSEMNDDQMSDDDLTLRPFQGKSSSQSSNSSSSKG